MATKMLSRSNSFRRDEQIKEMSLKRISSFFSRIAIIAARTELLSNSVLKLDLKLAVSLFVSSSQAPLHRNSLISEFMIDKLESVTLCFDIRLDNHSVDGRLKVSAKRMTTG